jgi:hypothetical protein
MLLGLSCVWRWSLQLWSVAASSIPSEPEQAFSRDVLLLCRAPRNRDGIPPLGARSRKEPRRPPCPVLAGGCAPPRLAECDVEVWAPVAPAGQPRSDTCPRKVWVHCSAPRHSSHPIASRSRTRGGSCVSQQIQEFFLPWTGGADKGLGACCECDASRQKLLNHSLLGWGGFLKLLLYSGIRSRQCAGSAHFPTGSVGYETNDEVYWCGTYVWRGLLV